MKAVHLPAHQAFLRYLEIPGADPPLLWLHGWQCTSSGELVGAAVQPSLSGRRSLLIDLLGHGYSDRPEEFTYTAEAHADTIVTLIDCLGLTQCGIVAHSMGATIAIHVAAARPETVSLLILAEGGPDLADREPGSLGRLAGQSEAEYVSTGYPALLTGLAETAVADPAGVSAVHLGITRVVDPRAIHREARSMDGADQGKLASLLVGLKMPRWYLQGQLSEREPDFEQLLSESAIGFSIVPAAGHPMGLQNPSGLAAAVAGVVAQAWERTEPEAIDS
jgi:pimeloyl-ACP methyl ester carboxylesterase